MMFHTAIDSILIGCGFALWSEFLSAPQILRWIKRLLPLVLIIPLIISPLLRARFGGAYSVTLGMTLDALCVGSLLILLMNQSAGKGLTSVLQVSSLQWLGRLSYSLYLWQQLFLTTLNHTWAGSFPISLGAALAMACLSYYFVETPLMRLKNRFVDVRLA
jgi:peptidoglycan/LPS O-acetylase OafA/YrhL